MGQELEALDRELHSPICAGLRGVKGPCEQMLQGDRCPQSNVSVNQLSCALYASRH